MDADGQKIAKKLCSSIAKETKRCRSILGDFNACILELNGDAPVVLSDVLSLTSKFWNQPSSRISAHKVPWKAKEEVIQAFLLFKRSGEELGLLKEDMMCTLRYWCQRLNIITEKLTELDCMEEDLYLRGAKCMLEQLRWEAEFSHGKAAVMFSQCIKLPAEVVYQAPDFDT